MKKIKESVFWKSPAKVSIVLFIVLEIITFWLQPNLLTMSWISLKAESAITLLFAAIGETFVLLVGGIDLSIAGVISITSSVAAVYMPVSYTHLAACRDQSESDRYPHTAPRIPHKGAAAKRAGRKYQPRFAHAAYSDPRLSEADPQGKPYSTGSGVSCDRSQKIPCTGASHYSVL